MLRLGDAQDASGGESRPKRLFLSLNVKIDSLRFIISENAYEIMK
jgi:hypothetical protein